MGSQLGYPPMEVLQASWAQIQGEYAYAIEQQEHKMYISLFKEVNTFPSFQSE